MTEAERSEGIKSIHQEATQTLIGSIERNGANTTCVIVFGSRAAGLAGPESDLDLFFLIDFESGDPDLLSDEVLVRTKSDGQATTIMSGEAGDVHLFLYNLDGLEKQLINYPNMGRSELFTGIATGKVIYGNEPQIEGKPLRTYINSRLETEKK